MKEKTQQNSTDSTLAPQQLKVIEALASGASVTKAAEMAGVDRTTIYLWRKDSNFEAALTSARLEYADTMRARLRELVDDAVKAVRDMLQNPDASAGIRLKAALAVLESVGAMAEDPGEATVIEQWRHDAMRWKNVGKPAALRIGWRF